MANAELMKARADGTSHVRKRGALNLSTAGWILDGDLTVPPTTPRHHSPLQHYPPSVLPLTR